MDEVPFDEEEGIPFDENTVDSIIERNLVAAKKIVRFDDDQRTSALDYVIERNVAEARNIVGQQTDDEAWSLASQQQDDDHSDNLDVYL